MQSSSRGTSVPQSLAEVREIIAELPDLAERRRRDLLSAIDTSCRKLGRSPACVSCTPVELRPLLLAVEPVAVGITAKSWSNIRSGLAAALFHAGVIDQDRRQGVALSPSWRRLRSSLANKFHRDALHRLMRFCSAKGIEADTVDDGVIDGFVDWLLNRTLVLKPAQCHRRTVQVWNDVVDTVVDWRQHKLTLPSHRQPPKRIQLEQLPAAFIRDLEAYLAMRAAPDPFNHEQPAKALAASTLRIRRQHLRLAAAALIESGQSIDTVTSLGALVSLDAFKTILRRMLEDHSGEANVWTEAVGKSLIAVAREWVRPGEAHISELKRLFARLPNTRPGMTPKNRAALRALRDETKLARLLYLSDDLFREAERAPEGNVRAAIKAQLAVALDILLTTGMRSDNLIRLQIGRQVFVPADRRQPIEIRLEASEVKNDMDGLYELEGDAAQRLRAYLQRFHPRLAPSGSPDLFVNQDGKPKKKVTLAAQLKTLTRTRVGMTINPHLFRHLVGTTLDEAHPENPELGRQMLLHKNIKTTRTYYSEGSSRRAQRLHDALLNERRKSLSHLGRRRVRRPNKPKV